MDRFRQTATSEENGGGSVEVQVRDIIDKKRKIVKKSMRTHEAKMTAFDQMECLDCYCTNNFDELQSGWEGPAILTHGSLIQFGCVSFVFSIVECTV